MWWVWLQKYRHVFGATVALALTFIAGWQAGRVTSPYYAAHPIIFSEGAQVSPPPDSLKALVVPSASPTATIAAAKQSGQFVGSVHSNIYHDPACSAASRIKAANQIWFASRPEAEAAGYAPSVCTKEKLGL